MRLPGYGRRDFVEILDRTLEKLGYKQGSALVQVLFELPDEQWRALTQAAIETTESRYFENRDPHAHSLVLELRLREGFPRAEFCRRISTPKDTFSAGTLQKVEYPSRKEKMPGEGAPIVTALTKRFNRSWEELTELVRSRPDAV